MENLRKSIIFDEELAEKIQKMANKSERDFSGQVRWIIKEYIRIIEGKG